MRSLTRDCSSKRPTSPLPRGEGGAQPRTVRRRAQRRVRGFVPDHFIQASFLLCLLSVSAASLQAQRNVAENPYKPTLDRLAAVTVLPLREWRTHAADQPHPEDPATDDSNWKAVETPPEPAARRRPAALAGPLWLRRQIELPKSVGGYDIQGGRSRLELDIEARDNFQMRVFFNGNLAAQQDQDTLEPILISEKAQPGQRILVAVGVMTPGPVWFRGARLHIDFPSRQPDPDALRDEILSAQALLAGIPTAKAEHEPELDAAVKAIDLAALERGDQQAFSRSLQAAQEKLRPLGEWMEQFQIRAVGNSHIDMAWLWPWTETVEVVRNTFTTALQLMREYPDFIYAQSSAQTYVWMEEKYPELFKEIQQRVKEGRWEIVGGMWVEPDLNMPAEESLVRQLLIGKRYFQEKFGVDVRIGWNPDSFGYNWQLPQIYKKSGLDYFVTQKIAWNDTTKFPHKLFWWQSPDGSRVLTYFPHDYANSIEPVRLATDMGEYASQTGFPEIMHLYGVGDHGGGPTREMLDTARRWQDPRMAFPRLTLGTAQGFFDDLQKNIGKLKIPAWNDELYLEFHRGVLTTQSETKKRIRQDEELLLNAEKFSSLASLYHRAYPQEQFESAWKRVLFDHFHDIMPGSGIAVNYLDAARNLEVVRLVGEKLLHGAEDELVAHVDTRGFTPPGTPRGLGVPVVVFNPLAWTRTDPAEVKVQFPDLVLGVEAQDSSGRLLPSAIVARNDATHTLTVRFVAESVPSLGYEVIHLKPMDNPQPGNTTLKASGSGMENEFVSVKVDPQTGCITSLLDKKTGRETLAPGACGNVLQAFQDKPRQWDAWNIDWDFEKVKWDLTEAQEVKLVENTPARAVTRVKKKFQNSSFVQDICMYPGVPRVDVNMQADWREKHILLKVAFPVSVRQPTDFATFEIPYGTIRRPTTRNTPAQKAKFEVPAQRWADLSDSEHGFSLLNASKYGYDAKGNVLRLSLLRSPEWPDPHADEGIHEFTYALYPHAGDWKQGGTERQGFQLNYPLLAVPAIGHQGSLPPALSFLSVEPSNVIVTALKKAEADDALVLRFYEFAGEACQVRMRLPAPASRAAETNLMEKEEHDLTLGSDGTEVTVAIQPYEIKSVKVWLQKK